METKKLTRIKKATKTTMNRLWKIAGGENCDPRTAEAAKLLFWTAKHIADKIIGYPETMYTEDGLAVRLPQFDKDFREFFDEVSAKHPKLVTVVDAGRCAIIKDINKLSMRLLAEYRITGKESGSAR